MKHQLALLLGLFACMFQVSLQAFPPLILSSTRLIPGLVKRLEGTKPNPYPAGKLDQIIKQLISRCSADAYILINQPGLTNDDFRSNDQRTFINLQSKLNHDSSVVSFPKIENYLSFEQISKYAVKSCQAELVKINIENEIQLEDGDQLPRYIDTKTRVIVVHFPRLPHSNFEHRKEVLEKHDEYIRRIIQRIPSPYLSFIVTSLDTSDNDENFFYSHPKNSLFMKTFKKTSPNFDPINWLTQDKRRLAEEHIHHELDFERPKNREDIPRRNKYEKFKQKEIEEANEIKLLTKDFFMDNEVLIIGLALIAVVFAIYVAVSIVANIFSTVKSLWRQRKARKTAVTEKKDK